MPLSGPIAGDPKTINYGTRSQHNSETILNWTEVVCVPGITYNSQQPGEGLILHTDLGSQYTSEDFEAALKDAEIKQSFSRKGCPYDNAGIESFHATLKIEEVYQTTYIDYETARLALFHYIESWYNRRRIHGAINYLTPQQLEDFCRNEAA